MGEADSQAWGDGLGAGYARSGPLDSPPSQWCSFQGRDRVFPWAQLVLNSRTTGSRWRLSNPTSHRDAKRLTHAVGICYCCSIAQSFLTLCQPMNCSMPDSLSFTISQSSHPLSQWCYPAISSSGTPFSFCPQSFPGSFQMSWLLESSSQRNGAAVSASVFPMNIQGWFPLGWTGLISLLSKGLSRVFFSTTVGCPIAQSSRSRGLAISAAQLAHPWWDSGL